MARKRKYETVREAMDPGTPAMARHFTCVPKMIDNNTRAMRVLDGTEIDKLLLDDVINITQHSTLNLFAQKLAGFGMLSLKSPSFEAKVQADASIVSDKKAEALRGAVKLFKRLDDTIGPYKRKKLVNLALQDAPWGALRHQIEDLHFCIRALDDVLMRR